MWKQQRTEILIASLSTESGFNNLSNFIDHFKCSIGMSLSEYRRIYRKQTPPDVV